MRVLESCHKSALEVKPVSESGDREFARLVDRVGGSLSEREARIVEKQVADEAYAEGNRPSGLVKRLVATLSFDSGLQPSIGLRAIGVPESRRQFVYSSEAADISINLRPRPHDGLSDLYGRIFPVDGTAPGAFGAQLLAGSSEAAATATNDLGEFSFDALPPGTYEVLASSDRVEVRLTGVEVCRRG